MKVRIKDSLVVAQGTQRFLRRYKEMISHGKFSNAALGSALHKFGLVFGGNIRSTHGGHFRHGRRIPVSAKAAGRRRVQTSRGKAKAPSSTLSIIKVQPTTQKSTKRQETAFIEV